MNSQTKTSDASIRLFLLAGLAGGLAGVAGVGFYGLISSTSVVEVARQITASVIPAATALPFAPAFGIFIHFLLSALLGVAFWTIAGGLIEWRLGWVLQRGSLRTTRNTQRAGNQRPFVMDAGSRSG